MVRTASRPRASVGPRSSMPRWSAPGARTASTAPVLICLASSLAVERTGAPAYWISTIIGTAAAFILLLPIAIWFSALFPVASDLGKTGYFEPVAPQLSTTVIGALASSPVGTATRKRLPSRVTSHAAVF